jgi:hypothetical protein
VISRRDEHASFMDGLVDDGFVILGGPLGRGSRRCSWSRRDEQEVAARMGEIPGHRSGCSASVR